ncbi:MAG: pyruvate kinase, partial [Stellaceae bacterium]
MARSNSKAAQPVLRRKRAAKVVATLGPASSTPGMIAALFQAGVDVFRLNFSHGTQDDHRERLETIRALETKTGRPIGVMADLQGPKLRLGTFKGGKVAIKAGQHFRLDLDKTPGDERRAPMPHPEIFAALEPGCDLLLDDGNVRLKVEAHGNDFADTVVVAGSALSDRKGVNVPDRMLPVSALTPKDRADLAYALKIGADWIALSFVQRPDDVAELKKIVSGRAAVLAKIEKPKA